MAGKLFEALRDRVILRSQIGKRKLDRTATRRALDKALRDLGERFGALARAGRVTIPGELAVVVKKVQDLELRLEQQERDLAELERESPAGSTT
ncbi:hypothetical protein [Anaeromyxobacter dehalogenans]|uniref:Uncharacterized protein n=1 Tax=Anaeromyxobacter dehalogenans (strain 2CP-C) TaxID=290397 RepID=Q2IKP0_ANADE|nr:hypothetical protein [Anaeromyxobacter dehalogenans]ABC82216.1 hypothetical protein Adeh_2446 [Anaeromyxobacter dehalogenans 2CP-C]